MEYRRLGKSGLQVSALSFGSWVTFGAQIGDDVSEKLMKTYFATKQDQSANNLDGQAPNAPAGS